MINKIILAIVFLGNTLLFGQTGGSLRGTISDESTGDGVEFACIQLSQKGEVVDKTITDIQGAYSFSKVNPGQYDLRVASIGYVKHLITDMSVDSSDMKLDIQISEMPIAETFVCVMYCFPRADEQDEAEGLELDSINFISIEEESAERVMPLEPAMAGVYPNPVKDQASIRIDSEIDVENGIVKLFDMNGNEVKIFRFSGKIVMIERQGLTAGMYMYQVNSGDKPIASGKMVVQ